MNSEKIKESIQHLSETISYKYSAIGWYFSSENIENSIVFKKDKWVCMCMYLRKVTKNRKRMQFSEDFGNACTGPAEYSGLCKLTDDDGQFISETERFKKNRELARRYYQESLKSIHSPKERYLYVEPIDDIDNDRTIEVVNFFPDLKGLASLVVLSNYDRKNNSDNVITPFASGCQSLFSVPYNEQFQEKPRSVIGLMDPQARLFIPDDMVSFSLPSNRLIEMTKNIKGSFLDRDFENPNGF